MDSRIFQKQCRSLVNKGFDTTLIVLNGKSENIDGVKIISLDFAFQSRLKRILFASKKIFDTAVDIKADIYHLHDPELLRIAVKLKRKTGSRVIYDSHEDLPKQVLDKHWIPSLFRNSISKFIYRYEMNKASKIDGVISVTDKICKRFVKVNDNVCLVANFPILSNQNKDYPITKKYDNTICYIGGLFPKRGIKELVQALDYCDAILHLAGSFSSKKFEKEVKSLKGWSKVNFHGYVSKNKIDEILLQSNIGIVILHPTESYKESLPIKMFEYMSAGLPLIASDFKMWKPFILDNECGLMVNPLNVNEIAKKIDYLLLNKEEAQKMGKAAFQAVHNNYSWSTQEKKLINFYNKILKC